MLVRIVCYVPPSPRQSNIWVRVDSMIVPRVYHAATLISQDNSVLITGGGYVSTISASVEKYIPATGCFHSMRNMPRTRYMHSSNQLPSFSDYVVLAGGLVPGLPALDVADLYHPMTGDTITMDLSLGRYLHTSVVLGTSQIALIGGYLSAANILNTADMLDTSTTPAFTAAINTMTLSRVYHTTTVLGNNSDLALVVGGLNGVALSSAYIYHGSSNSFLALGAGVTLTPARYSHTATYLPPPINKVLITGGVGTIVYGTMFLFDVLTYTFSTLTTTLVYPRYYHTATLLPNGKVLIVGGYNGSSMSTCELIDPANNYTVTLAANLAAGRYVHTTTFIPDSQNGTVLTCGGYDPPTNAINSCELYFV